MKTKLLFTALLISITQLVLAQTTSIPDSNFEQALIDLGIDTDGTINGQVATADIENVLTLDVNQKNISDLTGIEDFITLEELVFWSNQIIDLDVSQNTDLTKLNCSGNQLTTLDLTQNTALENLNCWGNQITTLNLTQNTVLEKLNFGFNQLTTLDLTQNTALEELSCQSTQLTTLNLTQNTALKLLLSDDNQITTLDLTQNIALEALNCWGNQLTTLNLTQNTALKNLSCGGNQLTTLDLTQNAALEIISCQGNQLELLNLKSGNTVGITNIFAFDNPNLECIQVDTDMVGNIPNDWEYDPGVTFSDDCEYLGVTDIDLSAIAIYPNPVTNKLNVTLSNNDSFQSLALYSITGTLLLTSKTTELDLSNLPASIYLLKIETAKGNIVKKIIKE